MSWTVPLILIADEDAAALAVYEELLRSVGYRTIACQMAREAQRRIEIERPDLLLVNLDLDWYEAGWDLLCWVRQEPATEVLPVIMCAADRQWLRVRQRQLQAWQCQVLEQPFSTAQLLTTVQAALEQAPLRSRAIGE